MTFFSKKILMAGVALSFMAAPYQLAAAEPFKPGLSGEISFELQNDLVTSADDPDAEVNTLYTTIEPNLMLAITPELTLEAALVFEPVQDTDPGDSTVFDNEGLYAEQLKLSYTTDHYSLFGGKYNPSFGTAWDLAPGVYGVDFAEDYETAERIGFGGSLMFGDDASGEYTLSANTFFMDTTFLSDSTVTKRGDVDKADGGSSNTQSLLSFSITLDSENIGGMQGLNTHVGYRNQAPGDADAGFDRETGYALGANYSFDLAKNIEAMALGEWVAINNLDGGDDNIDYLTTSFSVEINEHWNTAISYTRRDKDVNAAADENDHLFQVSGGYAFDNGISFDLGWETVEEAGEDKRGLGALLAYTYSFD